MIHRINIGIISTVTTIPQIVWQIYIIHNSHTNFAKAKLKLFELNYYKTNKCTVTFNPTKTSHINNTPIKPETAINHIAFTSKK